MKNRTRLLAGLLSLLLLFTSMPAAALAGEPFVPTKKAKDGTLVGDVNKNNAVDATDRMLLARYLAGWEGYEERILSMDAADIDRDGDVNAKDRMLLARFLAGWDGYEEYFTGYLVTFDGNSFDVENLPEPQTVKPGECAAEPTAPTKPIHVFTGWYTDEDCTAKFDFSTPVTDNLTLYAGWECEIYSKDLDEAHVREEEFEIDGETGTFTFVDNQLVVVVEDGITREALETTLSAYNGVIVGQIPDVGYYQVEFPEARAGADLQAFAEELTACTGIEDAFINLVLDYEPQYEYNPDDTFGITADDPADFEIELYDAWNASNITWHLRETKTRDAWDIVYKLNPYASIRMGLVENGISKHDDINFIEIKESSSANAEEIAHGTHVAGIMGAKHNNGTGVLGIAMGADILALTSPKKAEWYKLGKQVAELINQDCKVINVSMGQAIIEDEKIVLNKETYQKSFKKIEAAAQKTENLLQKLINKGRDFVIVTAAGNNASYKQYNDQTGKDEYFEVEYDDTVHNNIFTCIQKQEVKDRIIVVGNAEKNGSSIQRYYSSSYRNGRVDVMAPGTRIYSTVPTDYKASGYDYKYGTSMASPFVAGLAGLIWEANPSLSPERVKEIICETALIPVSDTANCGMVNCEAAVELAATKYFTIHFDANGGSGTMEDNSVKVVADPVNFTFPECGFTPPDVCEFKCWRMDNVDYAPGDVRTLNGSGSGTAYAVWSSPVYGDRLHSGTCGNNVTWMLFQDGTMIISGTGDMADYTEARYQPYNKYAGDITSVVIRDGVTNIGRGTFRGCTALTSVTIPDSVTAIRQSAFAGCTSLQNVTIPKTVTWIGDWAFSGCTSLTSITLHIGPDRAAFRNCTALKNVTFLNTVQSIGYEAFENCTALTSVTIPDSVTSIGMEAFSGCTSLRSVTIPASITSWGMLSFNGCTSLSSVTFQDGLTKIGEAAFMGCTSLTSVSIPTSVKSISSNAFYETGLTSVTIPSSVTYVGDAVFFECQSLQSVRFMGSAPSFGQSIFDGFNRVGVTATAYYPAGDESWTEDVRKDYGGNITWVAYEP